MIDFAADLPPALRRQLRRKPLNLPLAPGQAGIAGRDRFGRPVLATWEMVHAFLADEMAKFDALPPWQRRHIAEGRT